MEAPPPIDHARLAADKHAAVARLRQALRGSASEAIRDAFADLETLLTVCAQEGVPIGPDEDDLYATTRELLVH